MANPFLRYSLCLLLLAPAAPLQAQVTVARFHGDIPGAFAFTFDDALPTQLIYAVPYLDQVGLKGSFYLITGKIMDGPASAPAVGKPTTWADWKILLDHGHEVGSHTVTHPDLTTLASEEAARQLTESARTIKEKLGITPVTLAFPFNARNAAVSKLAAQTYIAAREFQSGYGDVAGFANTAEAMNKYADLAVLGKRFQVGMIHGLTEPYAPMDTAQFLAHLKYCKQLADDGKLWVATFGAIRKYQIEKDSIHIAVQSQSASRVSFVAATGLDAAVYDAPLTFLVAIAGSAPSAIKATREGAHAPLPATFASGNIQIEAIPGPGAITVEWTSTSAVRKDGTVKPDRKASHPVRKFLVSGKRVRALHK